MKIIAVVYVLADRGALRVADGPAGAVEGQSTGQPGGRREMLRLKSSAVLTDHTTKTR